MRQFSSDLCVMNLLNFCLLWCLFYKLYDWLFLGSSLDQNETEVDSSLSCKDKEKEKVETENESEKSKKDSKIDDNMRNVGSSIDSQQGLGSHPEALSSDTTTAPTRKNSLNLKSTKGLGLGMEEK